MRHRLTTPFVIVVTVLLVAAALLWSALARTVAEPVGQARTAEVLEPTADLGGDRDLQHDTPTRPRSAAG